MGEIVIISTQKKLDNEIEVLTQLFEAGLSTLHVRKPRFNKKKMKEFIQQIPSKFHNRLVLHSHHELALQFDLQGIHFKSKHRKNKFRTQLKKWRYRRKKAHLTFTTSFHKLVSLDLYNGKYDYVFLSPIFDSITKKDYQSGFAKYNLKNAIERTKFNVYALGGIDIEKIDKVNDLGFPGVALNGYIWTSSNPVQAFIDFKEAY